MIIDFDSYFKTYVYEPVDLCACYDPIFKPLFCRLSNEDVLDGESNSIANQRSILTRFAAEKGSTNIRELVDDGYTWTNFNRPGIQEGLSLVEQGLVGTWIVKDMSRFGRDYLQVGHYIDV